MTAPLDDPAPCNGEWFLTAEREDALRRNAQERVQCSEAQADRAIAHLEKMIEAARARNQAGENAVVAAAAGLETLGFLKEVNAALLVQTKIMHLIGMGSSTDAPFFRRIAAAIAKAEGRPDV